MKTRFAYAGVIALAMSAALGATPALARADVRIEVGPPEPHYEVVPAPRRGWVWAPGYWEWHHHRHVWVRGHWIRERPGYRWMADRWDHDGDRYVFVPGHWDR